MRCCPLKRASPLILSLGAPPPRVPGIATAADAAKPLYNVCLRDGCPPVGLFALHARLCDSYHLPYLLSYHTFLCDLLRSVAVGGPTPPGRPGFARPPLPISPHPLSLSHDGATPGTSPAHHCPVERERAISSPNKRFPEDGDPLGADDHSFVLNGCPAASVLFLFYLFSKNAITSLQRSFRNRGIHSFIHSLIRETATQELHRRHQGQPASRHRPSCGSLSKSRCLSQSGAAAGKSIVPGHRYKRVGRSKRIMERLTCVWVMRRTAVPRPTIDYS